ncbi:MAG: type II secretion system minor pseudopilin GspK [Desulfomonilia bacterium]|nr:type II secretion system minor pseudopilin GspK [Desulfomonilia bacterium]
MMHLVRDRKGLVLVLVLGVVALFTVMIVNFSTDQSFDIELAYNFRDAIQAQYLARAGVEAALVMLDQDDPTYDSEDEEWGGFSEYAAVASSFLEGPVFSGTLSDESAKFDLNSLGNHEEEEFRIAQFKRLFFLLEIDITEVELDDLANAVVDWIDPDDDTVFGAETDYYESLDVPYVCKNRPLDAPEEILLVKGMKPEYFYGTESYEGIQEYVTVSTGGKVNINTAKETVLRSMSDLMTDEVIQSILDCRPFRELDFFCIQGIDLEEDSAEVNWIKQSLDIKSRRFCVEAKGFMPSGAQVNVRAYLERIHNKARIVYYTIH